MVSSTTAPKSTSPESRPSAGASRRRLRDRFLGVVRRAEFGALVGTLVVYGFFVVTAHSSGFVTLAGTASWLDTAAELGILAVPVALLMIAGEFDLSVGSVIGATSMILSVSTTTYHWPLWLALIAVFAFGAAVGLVNGLLTTRTGLPSFIVTLVTYLSVSGAALGISVFAAGSTSVSLNTASGLRPVFASNWHELNVSILWWIAVVIVGGWVLARTRFGNWVYATGGEEEAARYAGIPTNRVKITMFIATATGAVLVATLQTTEFSGGEVGRGQSFVFNSIIAVVIGGVLLKGGYGSAIGAALGAMTYGIVSIGIFYTGWDTNWVQLFLGGLLLVAVLANDYFRKLALAAR